MANQTLSGLCECGCGEPTPVATRTRPYLGLVKDQPVRFLPGHNVPMRPLEDRFWEKVAKAGADECWVWEGSRDTSGYGLIGIGSRKDKTGRLEKAHRLSWEFAHGQIPDDLCVLHHCDNPPCVNPSHLWLGTKADNNRDRHAKGRTVMPWRE